MKRLMVLSALALPGCFAGDENDPPRASRDQIVASAARCGVPNFDPPIIGDQQTAYVARTIPNHAAKEDCIYADLEGHGLIATR